MCDERKYNVTPPPPTPTLPPLSPPKKKKKTEEEIKRGIKGRKKLIKINVYIWQQTCQDLND